jgi:hypothetical protein
MDINDSIWNITIQSAFHDYVEDVWEMVWLLHHSMPSEG